MNTQHTTAGKTATETVGVTETRKVKRSIQITFDDYQDRKDFDKLTDSIVSLLIDKQIPCSMSSFSQACRTEHLSEYDGCWVEEQCKVYQDRKNKCTCEVKA